MRNTKRTKERGTRKRMMNTNGGNERRTRGIYEQHEAAKWNQATRQELRDKKQTREKQTLGRNEQQEKEVFNKKNI